MLLSNTNEQNGFNKKTELNVFLKIFLRDLFLSACALIKSTTSQLTRPRQSAPKICQMKFVKNVKLRKESFSDIMDGIWKLFYFGLFGFIILQIFLTKFIHSLPVKSKKLCITFVGLI